MFKIDKSKKNPKKFCSPDWGSRQLKLCTECQTMLQVVCYNQSFIFWLRVNHTLHICTVGRSLCKWEVGEIKQVTPLVDCVRSGVGFDTWRRGHNVDRGHMHGWRGHMNDRGRMHSGRVHIEKNDRGHMVDGRPCKPKEGGVTSTVCQTATVKLWSWGNSLPNATRIHYRYGCGILHNLSQNSS